MPLVVLLALTVVSVANAQLLRAEWMRESVAPMRTTGSVAIRFEKTFVVIGVAPAGGGKVNHLFVWWPVGREFTPAAERYETAEVAYEPNTLTVMVPGNRLAMTFAVASVTGQQHVPEGFQSVVYGGGPLNHTFGEPAGRYTVSRKNGDVGIVVTPPSTALSIDGCILDGPYCSFSTFFTDSGDGTGGPASSHSECLSGGDPSSACSYAKNGGMIGVNGGESCSVSCPAGYYACCYDDCVLMTCTLRCKCFKSGTP